jgi:hypothetical protein
MGRPSAARALAVQEVCWQRPAKHRSMVSRACTQTNTNRHGCWARPGCPTGEEANSLDATLQVVPNATGL